MNFNRNRALILLVAFVFVLGFLSYIVFKFNPDILSFLHLNPKSSESAFNTLKDQEETSQSSDSNSSISFNEYVASDFKNSDPDNWNWQIDRIYAKLLNVDKENQEMTIIIKTPDNLSFSGVEKKVTDSCNPDNTYAYTRLNMNFVRNIPDISNYIGLDFFTYCMNETCDSIGKECIVIF